MDLDLEKKRVYETNPNDRNVPFINLIDLTKIQGKNGNGRSPNLV